MRFLRKLAALVLIGSAVAAFAAPNAGYIKSLRFVTGSNNRNFAVISTSSPQQVPSTQNWVGAEYSGVPYTVLVLPEDPTLLALVCASLERARQNTGTKFYYINVSAGANGSLANVSGIGESQWINLVSDWHLGE